MSEPYEPEIYKEHMIYNGRINKADGERYVDETIRWAIQRVSVFVVLDFE